MDFRQIILTVFLTCLTVLVLNHAYKYYLKKKKELKQKGKETILYNDIRDDSSQNSYNLQEAYHMLFIGKSPELNEVEQKINRSPIMYQNFIPEVQRVSFVEPESYSDSNEDSEHSFRFISGNII